MKDKTNNRIGIGIMVLGVAATALAVMSIGEKPWSSVAFDGLSGVLLVGFGWALRYKKKEEVCCAILRPDKLGEKKGEKKN